MEPHGKPVAPLSFADSLHERRELVARHPELNIVHKKSGQNLSFHISWNIYDLTKVKQTLDDFVSSFRNYVPYHRNYVPYHY